MAIVKPYLEVARSHINDTCAGLEPWQIIAFTFGITVLVFWIWDFLFQQEKSEFHQFHVSLSNSFIS